MRSEATTRPGPGFRPRVTRSRPKLKETNLYPPVKRYLEGQGYEVKGEIDDCDVVAVRRGQEPVVVELKLTLNLNVVLQAVARQRVSPAVYVGVPRRCPILRAQRRHVVRLFRMLGLGLLTVEVRRTGARVEAVLDPGEYRPRVSKRRTGHLLREFELRARPAPGDGDRIFEITYLAVDEAGNEARAKQQFTVRAKEEER